MTVRRGDANVFSMIDGVLKEACRKVGGVRELARRLNVTKQAINGFSIDGLSDERIEQISKIANISRDRLRKYWEEKASAKYDRAESERQSRMIAPRSELRPPLGPPSPEAIRHQWFLYRAYRRAFPCLYPDPPRYPEPPPPPFRAALPAAFATFRLVTLLDAPHIRNHLGFTVPVRAQLISCAKFLYDGKPFHLRPAGTYPPTPQGTWFDTRTVESFRLIARFFGASEVAVNDCVVFFPRGHTGGIG
jgi:hypothetical protein